jgi:uncharacterized membrane protein YphA (DoxX/SURF4 family)
MKLTNRMERPAKLLGRWNIPKLSPVLFGMTGIALLFCLALAIIGVMPRLALLACCIIYFLYFGQIRTLSYVVRKSNLIPQLLFVMALAPGLHRSFMETCPTWPILIGKILLIQVYVSAGYSKLRNSSFHWATSSQLQGILLLQHMKYDIPLAVKVARNERLCSALAILTLIHQLTFPIVLVVPRLEPYYVVTALLFHLSTRLLMQIDYLTYQGPAYLIFVVLPLGNYLLSIHVR